MEPNFEMRNYEAIYDTTRSLIKDGEGIVIPHFMAEPPCCQPIYPDPTLRRMSEDLAAGLVIIKKEAKRIPVKVIFNNPATIVYWADGTKTVVKCQDGDIYSKETGLALCFMKKFLGNSSRRMNDMLHKYVPKEDPTGDSPIETMRKFGKAVQKVMTERRDRNKDEASE